MIHLALIMILAPFGAPEIVIDEDGVVTVIESPEERAAEQRNMDMLAEAAQAYRVYHNTREGDLDEVIVKHEKLLESGMTLVPEVRSYIANALIDLRRERAKLSLGITGESLSPERLRALEEQVRAGAFQNEALDVVMEALQAEKNKLPAESNKGYAEIERDYRKQTATLREKIIDELPEEKALEAARMLFELAVLIAELDDAESVRQCAHYYARGRQKALEATLQDTEQQDEAVQRAEQCAKHLLTLLERRKDTVLSREIMKAYSQDWELVMEIEHLLSKMDLRVEEAERREHTAQRPTRAALVEAGELFTEALMKGSFSGGKNVLESAHNYAKIRQTALAAAQFNEAIPLSGTAAVLTGKSQVDGPNMAELCKKQLLAMLERQKDTATCREIMERYADDKELVLEIEKLLKKMESQ